MLKKYGLVLGIGLAIAIMVSLFVLGNKGNPSHTGDTAALLGDKHPDLGQKHIKVGEQHEGYNSNPPSSGPHYEQPAPWSTDITNIADEQFVHNAEHGGVVVTFKPSIGDDQVKALQAVLAKLPKSQQFNEVKVVITPREANTAPISLVAWGYTYDLQTFDEAKILQFYNDHLDKGPELVP